MSRWTCFLTIALLACLLAGGCAPSKTTQLTLVGQGKPLALSQRFAQGYCSRAADGNLDFLLVSDPEIGGPRQEDGQPLLPLSQEPMRQIVHIRLFWQTLRGVKPDYPAATNAVIDWYVIGDPSDRSAQYLHYSGIGYVLVDDTDDKGAHLEVRNATLGLVSHRGALVDPLGQAMLKGKAYTLSNDQKAVEILGQISAY